MSWNISSIWLFLTAFLSLASFKLWSISSIKIIEGWPFSTEAPQNLTMQGCWHTNPISHCCSNCFMDWGVKIWPIKYLAATRFPRNLAWLTTANVLLPITPPSWNCSVETTHDFLAAISEYKSINCCWVSISWSWMKDIFRRFSLFSSAKFEFFTFSNSISALRPSIVSCKHK